MILPHTLILCKDYVLIIKDGIVKVKQTKAVRSCYLTKTAWDSIFCAKHWSVCRLNRQFFGLEYLSNHWSLPLPFINNSPQAKHGWFLTLQDIYRKPQMLPQTCLATRDKFYHKKTNFQINACARYRILLLFTFTINCSKIAQLLHVTV